MLAALAIVWGMGCPGLQDEESVVLIVMDPVDQAPIAGVGVTALGGAKPSVGETDATGACTLVVQRTREQVELHLEKEGYDHSSWSAPRRKYVEVLLCRSCPPHLAIAGEDGSYELSGGSRELSTGRILIEADGFPSNVMSSGVDWLGPRVVDPDPEPAKLFGEVRVNGFGGELPGVVVWKGRSEEGRGAVNGNYRLEVEGGDVVLGFELDDCPELLEDTVLVSGSRNTYRARDVELRAPARPITGQVCFEDGPAARVKVRATCALPRKNSSHPRLVSAEERTDGEGRFTFDAPPWDHPFGIEVSIGEAVQKREAEAGASHVDFVFRRPSPLHLRAVDPRTGVLAQDDVSFWWRSSGESELRRFQSREAVDADCWLRYLVPNGELELEAWPRSEDLRPSRGWCVRIPSNGATTQVEFMLELGLEARLELVRDCEPIPPGCFVLLVEESAWDDVREHRSDGCGPTSWPYQYTGSSPALLRKDLFLFGGPAVLRGLSPGRYRLRAFLPDLAIEPESIDVVEAGANEFAVRWRKVP